MKMSKIESAMRVTLAYYKAFNHHDVAAMMQFISDDCTLESSTPAPDGEVYKGKEVITQYWQHFFDDARQAHIKIEEIFGLGMRCIAHWRYHWVDASGKKRHVRGVGIFRVKNDLIFETFTYRKG